MGMRISVRLLTTAFLVALGASQPAMAEEFFWYQSQEGTEIRAKARAYDLETGMVAFELADGSEAETPLLGLDIRSRSLVFANPEVRDDLKEQGWTLSQGYVVKVAIILAVLTLIFVGAYFIPFWMAGRVVTGEKGMRFHFRGFLKLAIVGFLISLVHFLIDAWEPLSEAIDSRVFPRLEELAASSNLYFDLFTLILQVVVGQFLIVGHYAIPFSKALWMMIVYWILLLITFVALTLIVVIVAIGFAAALDARAEPTDWFNEWVLRPLKLI